MIKRKITAGIFALALASSLMAADARSVSASVVLEESAGNRLQAQWAEDAAGGTEDDDGRIYVEGARYSGFYMDRAGVLYKVHKGVAEPKTGITKAGIRYYDCRKNKIQKLQNAAVYVEGKPYTGYYRSSKDRMYCVEKGKYEPKTGTLRAKTAYYSFPAGKTKKLSVQTVYVKGKVYSGYYLDQANRMYHVKKGKRVLESGTLKEETRYYSFKAGRIRKLSMPTVYVKGKVYTGYYTDKKNNMYRVTKGKRTLENGTLQAGCGYYSYTAGKTKKLSKQNVYVNGKAVRGMSSKSLETLQKAQKIVMSITDDSMSKKQKLKVCFDFVKTYRESRPRTPHYLGTDWPVVYANDMFGKGTGNCCSYAAAFAYMARAVGYEKVYCCNSGGHGWAEIDGLIYDPEWSLHHHECSFYALSYDAQKKQNYKGAISAGRAWMHVKI